MVDLAMSRRSDWLEAGAVRTQASWRQSRIRKRRKAALQARADDFVKDLNRTRSVIVHFGNAECIFSRV